MRDLGISDGWWSGSNIGGPKGGRCGSGAPTKVGTGGIRGIAGLGAIACMPPIEAGT